MNQQTGNTAAARLCAQLTNPETAYRPLPFWSWNDRLDPQELRRQIEQMQASGVGGYFMHARGGLQTEYLGEDWFRCIDTGVKAGHKAGLAPWVYDEEGWPSGFAGGKVNALGAWTYARGLHLRTLDSPADAACDDAVLGVYALPADGGILAVRDCAADPESGAGTRYVECSQTASPFYIDVLNEKVVRAFLDSTHEEYAKRFALGGDAGLSGFFTDEPRLSEGAIPWSEILPAAFRQAYGYDLLPVLPALFLPCGAYRAVRQDFWALVNRLFVHAYMEQIGAWCQAHNCRLTGHMMMEESLYAQMTGTGGVMPFYEHMQQPGVDSLRRAINDPRIPKQVGSVAEQLGKPHVLSESFAMGGWDMSFEEMRWIAGWQMVNGVNLICQHLQAYSLKGLRKRDYPPSLFYQQTWYEEYHRFNDVLARLGKLLSTSEKLVDVLLLHPMHSGWVSYDGTNNEELKKLDDSFAATCNLLSGAHLDYHLGDEVVMARHATLLTDGRIGIGRCAYSAVVLPDCLTLDSKTTALLTAFAAAGHPILYTGHWPTLCEGRPSEALTRLAAQALAVEADDIRHLRALLCPLQRIPVSIAAQGQEITDIACCTLALPQGGHALYLVNLSKSESHQATITLPGAQRPCLLDLDTLHLEPLYTESDPTATRCTLPMLPMQNAVLVFESGAAENAAAPALPCLPLGSGDWQIRSTEDNLLTLDACEYRIDGGAWQPQMPVLHLMNKLLEMRRACDIELRFHFFCAPEPDAFQRLCLVAEQPEQFAITVNGTPLKAAAQGWYKDISFSKLDIRPLVHSGDNIITFATRFAQNPHVYEVLYGENVYETESNKLTYDIELEAIYLLGDFGVYSKAPFTAGAGGSLHTDGPFELRSLPKRLHGGCLTTQGFPFFAGAITLYKAVTPPDGCTEVMLDLGHPHAGLVQATVNGQAEHTFLWPPYQYRTALPGTAEVEVTLYASNRNMLGPHHHTKGEPLSVGPSSWSGKFSWVERESEAVVITPAMRKQNYWLDGWSFVPFGLFD